jgi:hypothetical protein
MAAASRAGRSTAAVVALALLLTVLISAVGADAQPTTNQLPTIAFVARSDNPVDALAASAVAGQLGGFVALTYPTTLVEPARVALLEADPDLVVLAGGTAALSAEVELAIRTLLPDATVRRAAGTDRNATAGATAALLREMGAGQPLITGGSVAGDADLRGLLSVDDLQVRNGVDAATLGGQPPSAYAVAPTTVTESVSCVGQAFRPTASTTTYGAYSNQGLRVLNAGGSAVGVTCPIALPHGARLLEARFIVNDGSPTQSVDSVRINTYNVSDAGPSHSPRTPVPESTYAGTPGQILKVVDLGGWDGAVVDTNARTYVLTVVLGPDSDPGEVMGVRQASVTYEIDRIVQP